MPTPRLEDGTDAGTATYAVLVRPGEEILVGNGRRFRVLDEESMRWAWVDEDVDGRKGAFYGEAARAHRLITEAAQVQQIDPAMFFDPFVAAELLPLADQTRFPPRFEDLMDWMPDTAMHYLQYRFLSQYVHSSLLAAASTVVEEQGVLRNERRLPIAARLTVIRNAVASIGFVFDFTKAGLSWPGAVPMNFMVMSAAARLARITYPFAPASA
jgi:hypothetical protein